MLNGKKHSLDVNNQSLETAYMDKLDRFKMEVYSVQGYIQRYC